MSGSTNMDVERKKCPQCGNSHKDSSARNVGRGTALAGRGPPSSSHPGRSATNGGVSYFYGGSHNWGCPASSASSSCPACCGFARYTSSPGCGSARHERSSCCGSARDSSSAPQGPKLVYEFNFYKKYLKSGNANIDIERIRCELCYKYHKGECYLCPGCHWRHAESARCRRRPPPTYQSPPALAPAVSQPASRRRTNDGAK
jgi:hypothetical protein